MGCGVGVKRDGNNNVFNRGFHVIGFKKDQRCHRIRGFSKGIAAPSKCGINRAV